MKKITRFCKIQFAGVLKRGRHRSDDAGKKGGEQPPGSASSPICIGTYEAVRLRDVREKLEKELRDCASTLARRVRTEEELFYHSMMDYCDEINCGMCEKIKKRDKFDDYLGILGCPYGQGVLDNPCGDGLCRECDEATRDRIFHKLSDARRFPMVTLCFQDPSLEVASQMVGGEGWRSPAVLTAVTQRHVVSLPLHLAPCRISTLTDVSGIFSNTFNTARSE